jgi:hypothetical protein
MRKTSGNNSYSNSGNSCNNWKRQFLNFHKTSAANAKALEQHKEELDKIRFAQQENQVRQQTVLEQLEIEVAEIENVLQQLPAQANESEWKKNWMN